MNAKHAVLKAYTLYAWIERNPFEYKSGYPVKELLSPSFYFRCSLCEYAGFSGRADVARCIHYCPLYNQWPMENRSDHCGACHSHPASCYSIWAETLSSLSFSTADDIKNLPPDVHARMSRNAGDVAAALWRRYKQLELQELRKS